MVELFSSMLNTTAGTALLFIIVLGLFSILVPLVITLVNKLKTASKAPLGFEFEVSGGNSKKGVTVEATATPPTATIQTTSGHAIKIPLKVYELILDTFNTAFDDYVEKKMSVKTNTETDLKKKLEECVSTAIGSITLSYNLKKPADEKAIPGEREFLTLFLEAEFGKILTEELSKVKNDPKIHNWTDIETSDALSKIMKDVARRIQVVVIPLAILPFGKPLSSVISSIDYIIKEAVLPTIQAFVKSSKEEQEEYLKISEQKQKAVETRLQNILEVE
jgi:hypothetical protein